MFRRTVFKAGVREVELHRGLLMLLMLLMLLLALPLLRTKRRRLCCAGKVEASRCLPVS